ncbi:hypothetical protein PHYSODRAFT_353624 [Phytophthora sojae]|uniref:Uncharacterized protein n=1 Tax=Phytophthora sojae (strain P6497) TaxID=1094619 RepID=G4YPZ6_PHYSP|nr:hypothetical protein PHYSODRAFT_353624 [Phytophthora sojae]EGZ29311.1 hypothetical protein PHYSODRAFT_353624 [Phytophthora sojae]|eukprot:XP_009516586.1 hypothetical protein PHYSODRAFT_353624 [Phytophthora sojae]
MALSARGWRAQLLKDVDLHLLRAVAEIAGCLESTEGLNSGEAVGIDLTQALRELEMAAGEFKRRRGDCRPWSQLQSLRLKVSLV